MNIIGISESEKKLMQAAKELNDLKRIFDEKNFSGGIDSIAIFGKILKLGRLI